MKFLFAAVLVAIVSMLVPVRGLAQSNEELLRRLAALENSNAELKRENASLRIQIRHRENGKQIALMESKPRSAPVSGTASLSQSATAAYASAPTAAFNWSGFYVGAQSGYGATVLNSSGPPGISDPVPTGGFWGLQVGINKQFASSWLIGAEFDAALSRITATSIGPNPSDPTELLAGTVQLSNLMTLRGRFGFVEDQNLLYLTGGLAWSKVASSGSSGGGIGGPSPVRMTNVETTLPGWTVGGGVERALWGNWTGKVEYLYVRLNAFKEEQEVIQPSVQTIKVGVNYLLH